MYVDLERNSLEYGSWTTIDVPGGVKMYSTKEPTKGVSKVFKGQRFGKFHKGIFPPPLNPVFISKREYTCKHLGLELLNIPNWGSRSFSGYLGASVADRIRLVSKVLKPHHEIYQEPRDFSLQKAYANVEAGDFNSQLFLAELGETISMLSNPLAGLYKIHAKYRKSRKRLRDALKAGTNASADTYLQYMFGVSPLIKDVQSIYALAMEKATAKNQLYGRGRVASSETENDYSVLTNDLGFHSLEAWSTGKAETVTTGKVYYAMAFRNPMYDLIKKWGLNPLSLPVTLWEKQPLSFVVDWFFGVKTWLNAMMPKPGVSYLGNYVSEKLVEDVMIDRVHCRLAPGSPITRVLDSNLTKLWSLHNERLIREVNLPIPTAIYRGAGLNSLGKAVSSVALLTQKLKL